MGKRYYCDYCNRSFLDDIEARNKHLQGTLHTRMRKLHYNAFRDLKTLVQEESEKIACRRFMQTGECQFQESCTFTHYSKEQLNDLKRKVQEEEEESSKQTTGLPHDAVPTVEAWLQKRRKTGPLEAPPMLPMPAFMTSAVDLPVSVQPVCDELLANVEYNEWA